MTGDQYEISELSRLRHLYLKVRIWIGLWLFPQNPNAFLPPVLDDPHSGRASIPLVINIGFGQCIKPYARPSGVMAMKYIAKYSSTPVPHVLGAWRHPGKADFVWLLMTWIPGQTLESAWPDIRKKQRKQLGQQLCRYVSEWRQIPQPPVISGVVGSFTGGPVDDPGLDLFQPEGPFASFDKFLDYLLLPFTNNPEDQEDGLKCRETLVSRRNDPLFITHGDLTLRNIMVDYTNQCIVGIVDWDMAAWMPSFWEGYKATFDMHKKSLSQRTFVADAIQADWHDIEVLKTREKALIPRRKLIIELHPATCRN